MSSKVLPFEERDDGAEAQARRWIARIDAGDMTGDERAALHDWLQAAPDHKRLLDEHALLWAAASQARFPAGAKADATGAARADPAPHRRRPVYWVGGALAAGLVAVAVLLMRPARFDDAHHLQAHHQTGVGQHESVTLPDGSRTELNARSAITVAYAPERRRLVLERGVGMFEVAKDRQRPFEVLVGQAIVRAVGTRFLVQRRDSGGFEVTVYEGVVELTKAGGQPVRLAAGQVALALDDQTRLTHAAPAELERKLAWQQGRIVLDDSTLAEALEEVNRYSPQPVELADPSLAQIRLSGAFAARDVQVFLRSLEQGFNLRVRERQGRWVVSRQEKDS